MRFIVKNNKQGGFTLLELLISIVIISVIISIMFSAMRLGFRAWEKGEKNIEFTHRLRIVKAQMRRQMASICTENFLKSEKNRDLVPFVLRGDAQSVEFVSRYSIIPGSRSNLVYTKYYLKNEALDTQTLVIFEKDVSIIDDKELQNILDETDDDRGYTLIENMEHFEIQYLMKDKENNSEWISSWNMDRKESEFPIAVRINGAVSETPVTIIARFMTTDEK